jgi:DNA polymerase III epsilon subunit-like protein
MKFLISDVESVGLHPPPAPASGVVEAAYLELDMDTLEITNEVYSRVNPGCPIHPEASKVHGIYAEDVTDSPCLEDVYYIPDPAVHCGHSAQFDLKFLATRYDNLVGSLCTLALSRPGGNWIGTSAGTVPVAPHAEITSRKSGTFTRSLRACTST